jgi:hypothetical protein
VAGLSAQFINEFVGVGSILRRIFLPLTLVMSAAVVILRRVEETRR